MKPETSRILRLASATANESAALCAAASRHEGLNVADAANLRAIAEELHDLREAISHIAAARTATDSAAPPANPNEEKP